MKRACGRPASVRVAGGFAVAGEPIGGLPASLRRLTSLGAGDRERLHRVAYNELRLILVTTVARLRG